jgi:hypothetical protein
MKIHPVVYGALVLVLFMGIILGAQQFGFWSTSGKVNSSGQSAQPSAADTSSVKGWMTLEQVSTAFNVPVPEILAAFSLPADTAPSTALKDLESDTFDIPALRTWLESRAP